MGSSEALRHEPSAAKRTNGLTEGILLAEVFVGYSGRPKKGFQSTSGASKQSAAGQFTKAQLKRQTSFAP
jgi:hypothetical protein